MLWVVLLALPAHCAPVLRHTPAGVTLHMMLPYSAQPDDNGNALVWRLNLKKSDDGFTVDPDAMRAGNETSPQQAAGYQKEGHWR